MNFENKEIGKYLMKKRTLSLNELKRKTRME
jgi:hypothetical protein